MKYYLAGGLYGEENRKRFQLVSPSNELPYVWVNDYELAHEAAHCTHHAAIYMFLDDRTDLTTTPQGYLHNLSGHPENRSQDHYPDMVPLDDALASLLANAISHRRGMISEQLQKHIPEGFLVNDATINSAITAAQCGNITIEDAEQQLLEVIHASIEKDDTNDLCL